MKRTLLLLFTFLFVTFFSQTKQVPLPSYQKPLLITPFGGIKPNSGFFSSGDSLAGFNADAIEQNLLSRGLSARERFGYLESLKRNFIKQKYGLNVSPNPGPASVGKQTGGSASTFGAPCVNEGFEATSPGAYTSASAINGWTLSSGSTYTCITSSFSWTPGSSEFSIVATPISNVPNIGTIGQSPLGGSVVAQLNNQTPNFSVTRLSQSFPVTSSNSLFRYAFAGYYQDGGSGHGCCEQPGFNVVVKDCSGNIAACTSQSWNAPASGCSTTANSFSFNTSTSTYWTNWQIKQIDLSPYIGSCVTIDVYSYDCAFGGHLGTTFFDSECTYNFNGGLPSNTFINNPTPVNFCPGGVAQIVAPQGYNSYYWTAPSGATLVSNPPSVLTITNPIASSVYSLNMVNSLGCIFSATYMLAYSQVSVVAIAAKGTCTAGSSGATTVLATGSGSGYNYQWTNSSNSVVATSSIATNLAAGIYSVQITAAGNASCGISGATVAVLNNLVSTYNYNQPYCGSVAYLNPGSGSSYKWYSNVTAISGTTGTAPSFTVSSPTNGAIYRVAFTNSQGCRDSIIYTLAPSFSPTLALTNNQLTCEGSNNGLVIFSLNGSNAQGGSTSYSVFSTGTTPTYVSTSTLSSMNTLTASGLSGAGTYSIIVFDGACYATASFSVNTYYTANLYNLSVLGSTSICQGNSMYVNVAFTNTSNTNSQFTYTWMPNQFLVGNNNHLSSTLITPTAPSGGSALYIYTVTLSPTTAVCAVTRTLAVQVSNAGVATVTGPGQLCNSAGPATLTGSPAGGIFSGNPNGAVTSAGVLYPNLANLGANTFSYVYSINNCSSSATGNYTIVQGPVLTVSGNTSICAGQSTTLTASGAQFYLWPGIGISSQVVVSPASTTSYVVTGSSGNNCTDSKMVTVFVTPIPNISFTGNMDICEGDSTIITVSGADSLNWSIGGSNPTAILNPQTTTTYTVSGTNYPGGCFNSSAFTITVNPTPVISVSGPSYACQGDLVQLNASGANYYTWNSMPGGATYTSIINMSLGFTVTGSTSQNGCSNTVVHYIAADACLGIGNVTSGKAIDLYPNPVKNKVTMVLKTDGQVSIHDVAGKIIYRASMKKGEHLLDVSVYSEGIYFVTFSSGEETHTTRLIKD